MNNLLFKKRVCKCFQAFELNTNTIQGVYQPGEPGKVREIKIGQGKPGKVREFDQKQGKSGKNVFAFFLF